MRMCVLLNILFICSFLLGSDRRFISEEEYKKNLKKQLVSNISILKELSKYGINHNSYLKLEFFFYTDSENKAKALYNELLSMKYTLDTPHKSKKLWCINGWTSWINMSKYSILAWAEEMYELGYKHDCDFDGWGTEPDQELLPTEIKNRHNPDSYFNKAIELYDVQEYLSSLLYFNKYIELEPSDAEAYYNRALVKRELRNKEGAIEDLDKAIELQPDYSSALCNRGAEKDDLGNHEEAIQDYNKALAINSSDAFAYLNRGNSKYKMGNTNAACEDWKKAKELGLSEAEDRLKQFCK